MKFLDCTYLDKAPIGLGIGMQPCPLLSMHSGQTREPGTHKLLSERWWLEDRQPDGSFVPAALDKAYPRFFWEVLPVAISWDVIPASGWIMVDIEGADSYVADEKRDDAHNQQAFLNLHRLCEAVRLVRPDAKIGLNIQWHWPKTYNAAVPPPWAAALKCDGLFAQSGLNAAIDALCLELYFTDRPAPPAPSAGNDDWNFNDPIWGFRDGVSHACEWAMAVTDKAPVILTAMETGWGSSPARTGQFLTGPQMGRVLDLCANYSPQAIGIWGVAENSPGALNVGGFQFGVFNPSYPWLAEIKKRITP